MIYWLELIISYMIICQYLMKPWIPPLLANAVTLDSKSDINRVRCDPYRRYTIEETDACSVKHALFFVVPYTRCIIMIDF